ncbi:MAG: hypothetical protein HY302_00085 [Opitutae bacterium]|nr:hypothetical protein [Opitutae bacterium]
MPAALLALTPKCVLCVAAYVGLGAALGLGGPELCGGSAGGLSATHFVVAALAGGGVLFAASRIASRLAGPPKHK